MAVGHGALVGHGPCGIANYTPRTVRSAMNDRMKSSAVSGAQRELGRTDPGEGPQATFQIEGAWEAQASPRVS